MKKSLFIVSILCFYSFLGQAQICVGEQGKLDWKYWGNYLEASFAEIVTQTTYPRNPDTVKTIYRLQTPTNYDNMYGGMVEGFLRIDSVETITFNVTGNERAEFFLSTDDTPDNLVRIAYTNASTGSTEYDKYPEQTSVPITLQANTYYFFRLRHNDRYSSDFSSVQWKTDLVDINNFSVITSSFFYGVGCQPAKCPDPGTPCNDGNSSTTNDIEDGQCNCVGSMPKPNNCIGERSNITAYRYDDIASSSLENLYLDEDFPNAPHNGIKLNLLTYPEQNTLDYIGFMVRGYITVPVTGDYSFNVTGDDQTVFFLSTDEDPINKEDRMCNVTGWTHINEYDKYSTQTTDLISLTAGTYYYFEINHKEGAGGETFSVQWQLPNTPADEWKRIPSTYLYDYDCDLICINAGTSCDDGNIYTNNDVYVDCECIGTPCTGSDCDDPLANYTPYDDCGKSMLLDNNEGTSWLSCNLVPHPDVELRPGHWIEYDLGERHELIGSHIWNYNVHGEVDKGFEDVMVYTSEDGDNWTLFNNYTWPLATGESQYIGFEGPDFNGLFAQYVLFFCTNDDTCKGLGKVNFTAVLCPLMGTDCDDNNNLTILDHYDNNCECKGVPLDANLCTEQYLDLGNQILQTNNYSAETYIQSISQIGSNERVGMVGGSYVELLPGFQTDNSSLFLASIAECLEIPLTNDVQALKKAIKKEKEALEEQDKKAVLQIIPEPDSDYYTIKFYVEKASQVKLAIYDVTNTLQSELLNMEYSKPGIYKKRFRTKKLQDGIYQLKFSSNAVDMMKKFEVINNDL